VDIKPIKSEADYEATLEEVRELLDAQPGTPEADRLEVLVILVEAYETKHHPISAPDPVEAIEYHIESRGLRRRDLEPYIGHRGRVSEILNRRRRLTLDMIRNLNEGLGIPLDILVQPYELVSAGVVREIQEASRPLPSG
jgi:HTH-type transcriptional regulator/antitoxin HigA